MLCPRSVVTIHVARRRRCEYRIGPNRALDLVARLESQVLLVGLQVVEEADKVPIVILLQTTLKYVNLLIERGAFQGWLKRVDMLGIQSEEPFDQCAPAILDLRTGS